MENKGNQSRVFHYKQPLSSLEFNRIFSKTLPPGIYEGGSLNRINNNTISIEPLSVVIEDASLENSDIAVRIRTLEAIQFTVQLDINRPLIIVRYNWQDSIENYLEFMQVTEELNNGVNVALHSKDLIIGKVIHDGTKIAETNSFDFTRADKAFANPQSDHLLPLLVVRSPIGSGNEKKVYVEGGKIITTSGLIEFAGQYSPNISNTPSNQSRWDYVFLDDNGLIQIQEGEASLSPKTKPFYGRKVLAVIKRGPNRTDIKGADIFGCRSTDRAEIKTTMILVKDAGTNEVFAKNADGLITIDMALRELWNKSVVIENRTTDLENTYVTKATDQKIRGSKIFTTFPKFNNGLDSPITLIPSDEDHPITKKYYDDNNENGTGAVQVGTSSNLKNQTIYGEKIFTSMPKLNDGKTNPTVLEPSDNDHPVTIKHLNNDALVLRIGKAAEGLTPELKENQDIYGVKTFKDLPKFINRDGKSTLIPTNPSEPITKQYYENTTTGTSAVKVGTNESPSHQTIYGEKNFKNLPKFTGNSNIALKPSVDSHPVTLAYLNQDAQILRTGTLKSPVDQDVFGIKTFKSLPRFIGTDDKVLIPTLDSQPITKKYYDDSTTGAVQLGTVQKITGEKTITILPKLNDGTSKANTLIPTKEDHPITKKYYDDNNVNGTGAVQLGTSSNLKNQTIYGIKTFKNLPKFLNSEKIPKALEPTDDSHPVTKKYLDGKAPILRLGNSSSSESQTVYGIKTFRSLSEFSDGTKALIPTKDSHPITKKYYEDNNINGTGAVQLGTSTKPKNQTIYGIKTFNKSPIVPTTPDSNKSAVNKEYIKGSESGIVHKTGNETIAGEKTFTSEVTAPSFNANSSRKVKENIKDFNESAVEIVKKVKIVNYTYINDPDSYIHTGFIAEDTPEILTGKDHNTMALSDVCGVLLKAVQELTEEIKILKERE